LNQISVLKINIKNTEENIPFHPTILQVIAKVRFALATATLLVIPDFATGQMQFHFYAVALFWSFGAVPLPSIPHSKLPPFPTSYSSCDCEHKIHTIVAKQDK